MFTSEEMMPIIEQSLQWHFDVAQFWAVATNGKHKSFPRFQAKYVIKKHFGLFVQITIAYLLLVLATLLLMRNRKRFKLQYPLMVWNFALSIFSFYGSYVMLSAMVKTIRALGLYACACNEFSKMSPAAEHWLFLTVLLKALEFGNTFFLVLRKKPLSFLHVYHHVLAFLFLAHVYQTTSSLIRCIVIVNLLFNGFMYAYYFIRSMKIKLSIKAKALATSVYFVQLSLYSICFVTIYLANRRYSCDTPKLLLYTASGICFSYFVLFMFFFAKKYLRDDVLFLYRKLKTMKLD
uniref:Elongation of very long chain fatty acids protein n=2 Tax=Caenorhabditis japonica TaxID=281687 RepID=A0A8R1I6A8_CAEJA